MSREVKTDKQGDTERHHLRRSFWRVVLDRSLLRTKLFANISPSRDNWIFTGIGRSGLGLQYVTGQHDSRVELVIAISGDTGPGNKAIFDQLRGDQEAIEHTFGAELVWDRLDGRVSCRVRFGVPGGYRDPEDTWPATADRLVDAMIRLEAALRPHIDAIEL